MLNLHSLEAMNTLHRLRQTSLKTRVLALVSLLIIAGVWGLATIVIAVLQTDLEKLIVEHWSATLDYVADDIDRGMQVRIDALSRLAALITPEIQADRPRLQRLLQESDLSRALFPGGITCSDSRGIIYADSPVLAGRQGGSLEDREYFRNIMAGAKLAISSPVLARFVKKPIVALAVPLRDARGARTGVLVGSALLADPDLFGAIESTKVGRTGHFVVASPKDKLIVSATDKSRILTPLPERGVNPLLDRRLEEDLEVAGITVTSQGLETLTVSRKMKTTGWMVIGGMTTEEAFAPIATLKREIYFGALLISLLVALILRFVLKRELAPLEVAAAAMRRMSAGQQPFATIPAVRKDEIGQLLDSFNQLIEERNRLDENLRGEVAERRRGEAQVRYLNDNLERRVTDRTDALLVANRRLEEQIGERKIAEAAALDLAARLQVMTRRYAGAQESERRRLARELHDRVSSGLTAIGLSLGLIKGQLPREAAASVRERLSDTETLVREAIMTAREISHDLHPSVLDYGGVLPAMEDYGRKFSGHTGIPVDVLGTDRELRFPPETEIALYRIAQEALTNCAKHAKAGRVTISLDGDAEHGVFKISDDGVGFDRIRLKEGGKTPGLGLLSMRERAEAIGGKLTVESAPGAGTRITVAF